MQGVGWGESIYKGLEVGETGTVNDLNTVVDAFSLCKIPKIQQSRIVLVG